jgi:pimeloyl-ACP methyl ester carboxylesterase
MQRGWFVLAVFMLLSVPILSAQENAAFAPQPCPFELPAEEVEGETILCGTVEVPESRTGLSDATIQLAVVILHAVGEEQAPPIIYLAGGPGNSGTAAVEGFLDDDIREVVSIIFLDQRGTGYSQPSLDCPEITEGDSDTATEDCYNRLVESGIVLDAYRSSENAADVNDLISALELERVTLYGISYGTRLALTVLQDPHPAIQSVILDGVYPPNVYAYVDDGTNIARVFGLIFENCALDEACNATFPDLDTIFVTTFENLNSDPLIVTNEDGEEAEFNGDSLISELFSSFYITESIPFAPGLIYAAYNRDVATLQEFFYGDGSASAPSHHLLRLRQEPENDGNSEGMFYNFECADEMPFNTEDAIRAEAANLDMPPEWQEGAVQDALEVISLCESWVVTPSDESAKAATVSDIPALIFNGEYDPVTPPNWAEIAAETLSNHYMFTIPAGGHGVIDMSECTASIAAQFLTDPYTEPDGSCVADMPPVQWVVSEP